jgi:hypothetical protein
MPAAPRPPKATPTHAAPRAIDRAHEGPHLPLDKPATPRSLKPGLTPRARDWLASMYVDPWEAFAREHRKDGDLWPIGDVVVDAPELVFRGFECDSTICSPGLRRRGGKSCCAELTAYISQAEIDALRPHFDDVRAVMRRVEPRWSAESIDDCVERGDDLEWSLVKRRNRCVFGWVQPETGQILCGIHSMLLETSKSLGEFKPLTCQLFPLAVVPFGEKTLVTAISDTTRNVLGFGEAPKKFDCLGAPRTTVPLYQSMRTALVTMFGEAFYDELDRRASQALASR